jgi:hypothetical protein
MKKLHIPAILSVACLIVCLAGRATGQTAAPCEHLLQNCPRPLIELAKDFVVSKDPDCRYWTGPCTSENKIWREGVVRLGPGIGGSGGAWKLLVEGGITAEFLQIRRPEWSDYVFDDTFALRPLPEVAAFIRANGHLPGCTSGKTIEAEGGFLLDLETLHQQEKIEEIFLHLFDLRRRMDKLAARLPLASENPAPVGVAGPERTELENIPAIPAAAPGVSPQVACLQIRPAQTGMATGVGGVTITPGAGPYDLAWPGGQLINVLCDGTIRIENLSPGNHVVTVSDASGPLGTCILAIGIGQPADCSVFSDPACKIAIVQMLKEQAFDTPLDCVQWQGDPCSNTTGIHRLGRVGIGTSAVPSGYSLAVKGGILTDKVRIELCTSGNWCDYVFDDDYPLLPLTEVEQFVRTHRHLPGVFSQAKVSRDGGFELRAATLAQQEKIEEAFLYLIQLNKRKQELETRLNNLPTQQY